MNGSKLGESGTSLNVLAKANGKADRPFIILLALVAEDWLPRASRRPPMDNHTRFVPGGVGTTAVNRDILHSREGRRDQLFALARRSSANHLADAQQYS